MRSILPELAPVGIPTPVDVRALAFALANMTPDLLAPPQPGEAWDDVLARQAARADVLDDLLAEAGDLLAEAEAVTL